MDVRCRVDMDITEQLRHALSSYLGKKSLPKRPDGKVKSGSTYQYPLTKVATAAQIDAGQLSRFLHHKGTLSLAAATRLAKVLKLQLR